MPVAGRALSTRTCESFANQPLHHQTNGLVERFNQTLKDMIRKAATEDGKDWDKLFLYVLFAYGEVSPESIGFSPFLTVVGEGCRCAEGVQRVTRVHCLMC